MYYFCETIQNPAVIWHRPFPSQTFLMWFSFPDNSHQTDYRTSIRLQFHQLNRWWTKFYTCFPVNGWKDYDSRPSLASLGWLLSFVFLKKINVLPQTRISVYCVKDPGVAVALFSLFSLPTMWSYSRDFKTMLQWAKPNFSSCRLMDDGTGATAVVPRCQLHD